MKLRCEIELPDNADFKTKLDAMAQAGRDESKWQEVYSRDKMMDRTNLENKCGSCRFFIPKQYGQSKCYGDCFKGYVGYKQRSNKACRAYERKKGI